MNVRVVTTNFMSVWQQKIDIAIIVMSTDIQMENVKTFALSSPYQIMAD